MKWIFVLALLSAVGVCAEHPLVIQTDFGTKDGAVAAMKGVAVGVDANLAIFDLTHDNTPFDIWEAAYRLKQVAPYWPAGTVFVSVIDPGVGTARKSVVVQTNSGHFFVGPDNGTWTFIAEELGVAAVREIDGLRNRRAGSDQSHTFHGRDVYVFVGARLASGRLAFENVGPLFEPKVIQLAHERARHEGRALIGTIPYLDTNFGNVWTNLSGALLAKLTPELGDRFLVSVTRGGEEIFRGELPYVRTFGDVPAG
ncbi:MAG TPA: SAM-dependent chlorinase/fluorinase, partial [Opitutus sp.]|nr:SAM-dependent chlorinase/fluorinase [Opitutus sp.]